MPRDRIQAGTRGERAKQKWQRNLARNIEKWARMVKSSRSFDEYVRKISDFTGVPESEVRNSAPAQAYKDFQGEADDLKELLRDTASSENADKWLNNLQEAFRS